MIGFRGASRYYDERYRDGFALECRAMHKVREDMGLDERQADGAVLPHGRRGTPRASPRWRANGLVRGEHGLEVYVMCEIPSNVILAERVRRGLRRLLDRLATTSRSSCSASIAIRELVAHLFDERNEAVKRTDRAGDQRGARAPAARSASAARRPATIPSSPGSWSTEGIDSLSLNPDSQLKTMLAIVELEQTLALSPAGPLT